MINHPAADSTIEELVESSLLQPTGVDGTGEPRYRLHDMVRLYATELGAAIDSRESRLASSRLLVDAAIGLADAAARRLAPGALTRRELPPLPLPAELADRLVRDPRAWFDAERENLVNSIEAICSLGWYSRAVLLVEGLSVYLRCYDHHADLHACDAILARYADLRALA